MIGTSAVGHSILKGRVELVEGHPDSLTKVCLTRPREFQELALYTEKTERRLYAARKGLTEEVNRTPTDLTRSEKYIYFDCYLLPEKRPKRDRNGEVVGEIVPKSRPPEEGEKLTLILRRNNSKDKVSIKEFTCVVQEVYWGRWVRSLLDDAEDVFHKGDEMKEINSVGLVMVKVSDDFDRSLISDTHYNLQKYSRPRAA